MSYRNPYERGTNLTYAYNAGSNDSYYGRGCCPHYYADGNKLFGAEITELTEEERKAYYLGFEDNEALGDFKNWE